MRYVNIDNNWVDESGNIFPSLTAKEIVEGNQHHYEYVFESKNSFVWSEIHVDNNGFLHNEEGPTLVLDSHFINQYYWYGKHIFTTYTFNP